MISSKCIRLGGKDDQGAKAQGFADRLYKVRHTEKHNIRSPHHTSRFLTMQISTNEHANNIRGTCESRMVPLTFFHLRSRSRQHSLSAMLLPSPRAATQTCMRQSPRCNKSSQRYHSNGTRGTTQSKYLRFKDIKSDRLHYTYNSSLKKVLDGSGFGTRTSCNL